MSFESGDVRYAKSGSVHIGYRVFGAGPLDIVLVSGLTSNIDAGFWAPEEADELEALGRIARCIIFDKRGTGISDRVTGAPPLEERMEDVRSVMEAANSAHAVIYGRADGGAMSILFAATYPERTLALILANPRPRFTSAHDYPWAPTPEEYERQTDREVDAWGTRGQALAIAHRVGLEEDEGTLARLARRMRLAASPGAARALRDMNADIDVRPVLTSVRVPTLIIHDPASAERAQYVADQIPDAERVALEAATLTGMVQRLDAFLSRAQEDWAYRTAQPERVLATVLFTDLVGSTSKAIELGPRWPELLREHNLRIRRELARYRGHEIDTAGDGFFASGFDGPARAIRCACAIRDAIQDLGLGVRVGVHTGECDLVDGKLAGLAVVVGSRIAAQADAGEVVVSGTVRDLVAGSGLSSSHGERGSSRAWAGGRSSRFGVRPASTLRVREVPRRWSRRIAWTCPVGPALDGSFRRELRPAGRGVGTTLRSRSVASANANASLPRRPRAAWTLRLLRRRPLLSASCVSRSGDASFLVSPLSGSGWDAVR
jgi:class 3 adenylate cyclase